jgi:hypothetical protein
MAHRWDSGRATAALAASQARDIVFHTFLHAYRHPKYPAPRGRFSPAKNGHSGVRMDARANLAPAQPLRGGGSGSLATWHYLRRGGSPGGSMLENSRCATQLNEPIPINGCGPNRSRIGNSAFSSATERRSTTDGTVGRTTTWGKRTGHAGMKHAPPGSGRVFRHGDTANPALGELASAAYRLSDRFATHRRRGTFCPPGQPRWRTIPELAKSKELTAHRRRRSPVS